ncbi:hypothetical protein J5N97_017003 [Dioscorea zingiberensis]|uniref:Uncharacterized protein n=1 Tax=Dioscorea zingiberensis TaxID=325984 RepID=A0A9D5CME5_9LILI|nr:hypothetical protein J5N97_017003 [Dioscorea zingiberensis]
MSRKPVSSSLLGIVSNKEMGALLGHEESQEGEEALNGKGKGHVLELGMVSNDECRIFEINAQNDFITNSRDAEHGKQVETVMSKQPILSLNEEEVNVADPDNVEEEIDSMWKIELDLEGDMENSDMVDTYLIKDGRES